MIEQVLRHPEKLHTLVERKDRRHGDLTIHSSDKLRMMQGLGAKSYREFKKLQSDLLEWRRRAANQTV